MDFRETPEQAAWRAAVRSVIRENLPEPLKGITGLFWQTDRKDALEQWRRVLAERRWIAPAWPKEYGGAGMTVAEQFILNEEFAEASAPQLGGIGVAMLGPTLITHGNEEQKKQHLPRILDGTVQWCQGYSEPGSGSDLASLQTRAVRDGDDFVINGQKIWTTQAHRADWCFCLARTDPDAPKHKGISYFLIDMKSPGVMVRPLVNMANGHDFNEVYFEDVRVPASNVVGEVNRGWYVATTTLDFERSAVSNSVGQRKSVERAAGWMRENRARIAPAAFASARTRWAEHAVEVQVATLLGHRVISMQAAGQIPNSEASVVKLYSSELSQRIAATEVTTLGMWGGLTDPRAPFGGQVALGYMGAVPLTIAGGTSEIQRNIIATRGLGLPRA
jgi:alkylation response protein AidB-like acyl-CoA dehydrogenase